MCEFVSSYRLRPRCVLSRKNCPVFYPLLACARRTYKMKLFEQLNFPQMNARSCYARFFVLVVTRTKIGAHIVAIRKVEQKVFLMILLFCILHIMFVTNTLDCLYNIFPNTNRRPVERIFITCECIRFNVLQTQSVHKNNPAAIVSVSILCVTDDLVHGMLIN